MSAVSATRSAASGARSRLDAYRDDGALAYLLGRELGALIPLSGAALTVLSALPLVAVVAIDGEGVSDVTLGAAVAWGVLAGSLASGRPDSGRFAWTVPPILRLVEYGTLLAFALLARPPAVPFCFALVAALAFHHYDTVYRLRHQGVAPPTWLSLASGGWDGRMVLGYVLLLTGAVSAGFLVAAIALAVVYVAESAVSWLRFSQPRGPAVYEEEEDEDD
jgi:hypothetical protein